MRIGINFGDNDYYFTFYPMMQAIASALTVSHPNNKKELTKPQIVEIVNGLAYPFYRLCQNRWRYGNVDDIRLKEYLRIKERQVFINEEIDKKLEDIRWCNGEFFYLDTESGQIDCY